MGSFDDLIAIIRCTVFEPTEDAFNKLAQEKVSKAAESGESRGVEEALAIDYPANEESFWTIQLKLPCG